jgi:hypothetical protein
MSLECTVRDGIVTVTSEGDYSFADGMTAIERVVFHPKYRLGMPVLLDGRLSTAHPPPDGYRRAVSVLACLVNPGQQLRVAIVTTEARAAMAERLAEALRHIWMHACVFADPVEAATWLGGKDDDGATVRTVTRPGAAE